MRVHVFRLPYDFLQQLDLNTASPILAAGSRREPAFADSSESIRYFAAFLALPRTAFSTELRHVMLTGY